MISEDKMDTDNWNVKGSNITIEEAPDLPTAENTEKTAKVYEEDTDKAVESEDKRKASNGDKKGLNAGRIILCVIVALIALAFPKICGATGLTYVIMDLVWSMGLYVSLDSGMLVSWFVVILIAVIIIMSVLRNIDKAAESEDKKKASNDDKKGLNAGSIILCVIVALIALAFPKICGTTGLTYAIYDFCLYLRIPYTIGLLVPWIAVIAIAVIIIMSVLRKKR